MRVTLECPMAEYRAGMKIYCKKTNSFCGNAFYKRCKGWWALTEKAKRCPLRREENDKP